METMITTRPTLATELQENGIEVKKTVNPFNECLTAWTFSADQKSIDIVVQYYDRIGKKLPHSVQNFITKHNTTVGEENE